MPLSARARYSSTILAGHYCQHTFSPAFTLTPVLGHCVPAWVHGLDLVLRHCMVLGYLEFQYLNATLFSAGDRELALKHQVWTQLKLRPFSSSFVLNFPLLQQAYPVISDDYNSRTAIMQIRKPFLLAKLIDSIIDYA